MRNQILVLVVLAIVSGLAIWYASHRAERAETEKHWVHLKGFAGAVERGSVKSMKPVNLSVWRYRSDKIPETTYEHLEFEIPAAYLYMKDDLAGGKQKDIDLVVHWPTGDPDGFHEDLEPYNHKSAGWPIEKYRAEIKSWGPPVINSPAAERERLLKAILKKEWSNPNPYRGEYCGWHAFDEINSGTNTLEHENPKSGVTSEIYFDSLEPLSWERHIRCAGNMRVCTLHTSFQRFSLAISFSPHNICRAEELETQARGLLDEFLVAHHPPTRVWGADPPGKRYPFENAHEWTRDNLNNPNIREAAGRYTYRGEIVVKRPAAKIQNEP